MALSQETCVPCRDGGLTLGAAEIQALLGELRGWQVEEQHHLLKRWSFNDFQSALDWLVRLGAICEQQGHHADFAVGWGYVQATVHTHKAGGLTRSDFVLAARFDAEQTPTAYSAYARRTSS